MLRHSRYETLQYFHSIPVDVPRPGSWTECAAWYLPNTGILAYLMYLMHVPLFQQLAPLLGDERTRVPTPLRRQLDPEAGTLDIRAESPCYLLLREH